MSDEAGKTRRNLVVLSSAIVTAAFLEVPLQGQLVGVVDLAKVNTARAWWAAIFGLIYFLMRYLLDPANLEHLKAWVADARKSQPEYVLRYLHSAEAARHWTTWTLEKQNPLPTGAAKLMVYYPHDRPAWAYDAKTKIATAHANWQEQSRADDGTYLPSRDLSDFFQVSQVVPPPVRLKSWLFALLRTVRITWQFTEYVVPVLWSTVALIISVGKLCGAGDTLFLGPYSCT